MGKRNTFDELQELARKPSTWWAAAKWVFGVLLPAAVAAAAAAMSWSSQLATKGFVEDKCGGVEKRSLAALAAHQAASESARADIDERLKAFEDLELEQQLKLSRSEREEAFRWIVRRTAADLESRRKRRAEAVGRAEDRFDRLIAAGKSLDDAARLAISGRPPY